MLNVYSKYINNEALGKFRVFKIGGQIASNVKCADDLVLEAEEEMVLQNLLTNSMEQSPS